jgi:hypothetical protein
MSITPGFGGLSGIILQTWEGIMLHAAYSGGGSGEKRSKSPLLQEVRNHTRRLHMSIRTEQAYVQWIEQFLRYQRDKSGSWQHPRDLGNGEINDFLTYLAVQRKVSASTQNQALSAER